ncbi:TetR/AcrR family transcriptional regulator [Bradyrhizobium sp. WD16]|uniref:TetR/AcrR family transcriptional regulator n=1 Tax=Bradyrhizobium sp. WD16 TaxID=1521768 RepID=UPI0020A588F3|nr:TetR/AcrR family transcriptional regulator [Bradyrhizobium sp. WD16]UTD25653.1 TetR family transcriptional regulator [Bradyrhizobium sp. WD16]
MDNPSRSERSRNAALQAALTIVARDGPGRLTLDAIARESGLSKGGVMHQFRTKQAVLKALLEHQTAYFEDFSRQYIAKTTSSQPELAAQIATLREVIARPRSEAFAILAALADDPGLLAGSRDIDARKVKTLKAEAADPQLALLRWSAARGLALSALFGLCPLADRDRNELFERLLDDAQWTTLAKRPARRPASPGRAGKAKPTARASERSRRLKKST